MSSVRPGGVFEVDYLHTRHFTLEEAQSALTSVRGLVIELTSLKKTLDTQGYDITRHEYFGGIGPNGDGVYPPEVERLVAVLGMLEDRGIIVKGLEDGLVDFPHLRQNGEEVYLCYMAGEDRIRFWHTIDGGFAGRQPVDTL